ncbi:MAG TPA: Ig domain-containing protein, partial [Verrucomicrobiae bacterium]|nr:Ig domain-containing protein [Verrucomicrobiae bacterium]
NLNFETPVPGSQLEVTNSQLQLLQTSDLGALLQFAQTNPPAAVQAAFPGIEIDSFYTYYTVVSNPIVVSYFTNYVGGNFQATPFLFIATNGYTYTAQTNYVYNFGNVVIVDYHSNTVAKLVTVSLYRPNGANYQAPPLTNVTSQTIVLTNVPSGDYYLIPPGSCGFGFYKTILSNAFAGAVTNSITTATNTFTYFNAPAGFVGSQSIVTFFTNNWYEVYGCTLQTPGAALYQGVGKVNFVKADYDSTIGQFYQPITNNFTMVTVTNSKPVLQHFQRIVTQPDILLDAEDWDSPNVAQIGPGFPPFARNVTYTQDPQVPGAVPSSGPGTITDYPVTISYNDAGNVFYVFGTEVNQTNEFVSEFPIFLWGSFDNSTNAPTIYPDGTSIQNLENEILIRITPTILPDATNGVPYSQTFTTTGGSFTPPYTWSMGLDLTTQKTSVLPLGLNLSPGGTISGTPTNNPVGTYDFVIQMMDYNGRNVTWNYSLNIDP